MQVVDRLEEVKRNIRAIQKGYQERGLRWEENDDVRSRWFDTTWKSLTLVQAHMHLYTRYLARIEFWQSISRNFPEALLPVLQSEASSWYKFGLVHSTYSLTEEQLRRIAEVWDPHWMAARRSIAAVTHRLTQHLSLQRYDELFRLTRLIRNSIHNNGHHRPDPPHGDEDVTWKGTVYEFRVDKPILWVEWEFIADHIADIAEAMEAVVSHPDIEKLPTITR